MNIRCGAGILLLAAVICSAGMGTRGQNPSREPAVNLNQIPPGLTVEAQLVRLKQPMVKLIDGKRRQVREFVEFRVTAQGPFVARALDPVLMVGGRQVTEYRYARNNELIFAEYEPQKLPDGEVVHFQWGFHPAAGARQETTFKFFREKLQVVTRDVATGKR